LTAKPNSSTAFRLPQGLLATVDLICDQQDLTRSQVYRRSIMEYLKRGRDCGATDGATKIHLVRSPLRPKSMIGQSKQREITRKSELVEELRKADFDKVQVFEEVSSAQAVENYIRQNRQWHHSIVVISHR
jgi:hypothetical protein